MVCGGAWGDGAAAGAGRSAGDVVVAIPPLAGCSGVGDAGADSVMANVATIASAADVLSPTVRIRLDPAAWRRRPGFRADVLDGVRAAARSALALRSSLMASVIVVLGTMVVSALAAVAVVFTGPRW